MNTVELDIKAGKLHRKTGITLLAGFAVLLFVGAGITNDLLLKTSIDRSRAFLSVEEGLSRACALKAPCDWLTVDFVRQAGFVSLGDTEILGLGEDYIIEVAEDGMNATARPEGFFWGYAPRKDEIDKAYDIAAMSIDDFSATPAIISNL